MRLTALKTMIAALLLAQGFEARADVTLGWNASAGATPITNYTVYWGTNSGVYVFQQYTGTATTLTVPGLAANTVYYFTVTETDQNGLESLDSNQIVFTNAPVITPPIPPGGGGTTNAANTSGGASRGSAGSAGSGGSTSVSRSTGEISIPGIPPVLTLSFTNHHPLLSISGTVGSTLMIQSSTNPVNRNTWTTITNLAMTNPAKGAATNPASPSTINLAFVPAAQKYEVINTTHPACEFYQVVMPYDYMVLADAVLSNQGYTNRLVLVRMPGISNADVCYVAPQSSFLYYDATNSAFALEPSGSTIRQIAATLSSSLGQNWTSASEFAYSNGVTTLLATVVETEPASSDPVAGASTASIQIDF